MAFISTTGESFGTREELARAEQLYDPNTDPAKLSGESKLQFEAEQAPTQLASTNPEANLDTVTTSSTGLRGDASTTQTSIDRKFAEIEDAGAASVTASEKDYDSRMDVWEKRLEQDLQSINEQFDIRREETETAQKQEKGTTSLGLARIGGYLGGSASETGALLSLAKSHRSEISLLESRRRQSVQSAKSASEDKRFLLAQQKLEESKQIQADIETRKANYIDKTLEIQEDIQKRMEDARDFAVDNEIQKPFYTLDGNTFFDTATGQMVQDMDRIGEQDYQILEPGQAATKFETRTIAGKVVRFGFDSNGEVVSRTELGSSKSTSSSSSSGVVSGYNITTSQKRKADAYLDKISNKTMALDDVLEEAPIETHKYIQDNADVPEEETTQIEEPKEVNFKQAKQNFDYAITAIKQGADFEAVVQRLLNDLRIGEGSYRQPVGGINLKDSEKGIRARLKNATKPTK